MYDQNQSEGTEESREREEHCQIFFLCLQGALPGTFQFFQCMDVLDNRGSTDTCPPQSAVPEACKYNLVVGGFLTLTP